MEKQQFDMQKRTRANITAAFRALVSGYLAWLGSKIANAEGSSMPALTAQLISAAFIIAALGFGVYTWKRWRSDLEAARLSATIQPDTTQEEDQCED